MGLIRLQVRCLLEEVEMEEAVVEMEVVVVEMEVVVVEEVVEEEVVVVVDVDKRRCYGW